MPKVALLLIDPQNDFIETTGALCVPGAIEDTVRTISFIDNNIDCIDAIYVTLDYHQLEHIAHADWWVNAQGQEPEPFTQISAQDVAQGKWRAKNADHQAHSLDYVQKLEAQGKYKHTIWPKHCIQNTLGCEPPANLKAALKRWEAAAGKEVTYVHKGMSPMTEQFSALKAEVPQKDDAYTELNVALIKELDSYEQIITAGQALSHCVANTVEDLIDNIQTPKKGKKAQKVLLLRDCCSNVNGCEGMGKKFIESAQKRGMRTISSSITLTSASAVIAASETRRSFTGREPDSNPLLNSSTNHNRQVEKNSCCNLI